MRHAMNQASPGHLEAMAQQTVRRAQGQPRETRGGRRGGGGGGGGAQKLEGKLRKAGKLMSAAVAAGARYTRGGLVGDLQKRVTLAHEALLLTHEAKELSMGRDVDALDPLARDDNCHATLCWALEEWQLPPRQEPPSNVIKLKDNEIGERKPWALADVKFARPLLSAAVNAGIFIMWAAQSNGGRQLALARLAAGA